jgi:hypothetical protein
MRRQELADDILLLLAEIDTALGAGRFEISHWLAAYPEHIDDITDYIAEHCLLQVSAPPSPEEKAAFSAAAQRALQAAGYADAPPFESLLKRASSLGLSPAALAKRLGIGLSVLAKLEKRLVEVSTIPVRLIEALGQTLQETQSAIAAYLALPPYTPETLRARALTLQEHTLREDQRQDFRTAVLSASDMTEEQRKQWTDTGDDG